VRSLLGSAASGAGHAAGVRCVARDTDRFAGRRIEAVPKVQAEGFVLGFVGACQGRAKERRRAPVQRVEKQFESTRRIDKKSIVILKKHRLCL
jgi:hypothetical protein